MNMKYICTLVFLFVSSVYALRAQTDLAAYGFKGQVKAVYYYIYNEARFDADGKFIDEKKQPYIEKALFFDKKGNIDSVVEVLSEGRFYEKYISIHVHVGNRIKSVTKYRYYTNEVMEETKYLWTEKNLKCSFKGVGFSTLSKGYKVLAFNHRESRGEYETETKKGVLLLKESYKNEFDTYWNLLKTHYNNAEKGNYTIVYDYDDMDDMGNYQQVKLLYEDSKKLQRFILKKFYYH